MLYIVRHGETEFNRARIAQGSGIDAPLNATGLDQAKKLAQMYANYNIKHFYASTLQRTQQTIQFLTTSPIILPELNEISWGILEGTPEVDANGHRVSEFQHALAAWSNGDYYQSVPKGESAMDVAIRLQRVMPQILSHGDDNVLVCTHGRTMRMLLCLLTSTSLSQQEEFLHKNTSVYAINSGVIEQYNNLSHLA
jgi:phosphoserine phosphatase